MPGRLTRQPSTPSDEIFRFASNDTGGVIACFKAGGQEKFVGLCRPTPPAVPAQDDTRIDFFTASQDESANSTQWWSCCDQGRLRRHLLGQKHRQRDTETGPASQPRAGHRHSSSVQFHQLANDSQTKT